MPCWTSFPASSDPSVGIRILVYIVISLITTLLQRRTGCQRFELKRARPKNGGGSQALRLWRSGSTRHEQHRVLRVLQHRGRDLAEIHRLAGRAADPHYDQIITPEARLPQDGVLGRDI